MERNVPFKLQEVLDEDKISVLEYFLQLSFFTTDLHITNCWSFSPDSELDSFKKASKEKYGGSLLSFCVDMNKLEPPQSFENCVNAKNMSLDYTKQLFEYGTISPPCGFQGTRTKRAANPTGTFTVLLFKVALGSVYSYTPTSSNDQGNKTHSAENFVKLVIPEGFHSAELVTNTDPRRFNCLYRVANADQVFLHCAVEFEFTPLRVQVLDAVCEMCESAMATWYCHSDRANFCNSCDMKQHSATRIFSRHIRIPCSKSPNQFGICEHHPTDVVEMVCLKVGAAHAQCSALLCNNCILFGSHSNPSFLDHPLMSTLDTYELSLEKNSDSDEKLKLRRNQVSDKIKNRHNLTSHIYANSKGVEDKIEYCNRTILSRLAEMKTKKLNYLAAIEREVNTQLRIVEWMQVRRQHAQGFLDHLLLALEPCQFIMFKRRYDLLVQKYFTKDLKDYFDLPVWMSKPLTLVGDTRITCASIQSMARSLSARSDRQPTSYAAESYPEDPGVRDKLLDWTPLNMYEDLEETVGRVDQAGCRLAEAGPKPPASAAADLAGATLVDGPASAVHELEVRDTATKLWRFLSDLKMGTAVHLLKHEMTGLVRDFGYCVLLRSSGVLGDVVAALFCSPAAPRDVTDFLRQITAPLEHHFSLYLASAPAAESSEPDPALREHVANAMVEVLAKLVPLDLLSLPANFQFVVRALADLFEALKVASRPHVVADFFLTVLSSYVLRWLGQSGSAAHLLGLGSADADSKAKYDRLRLFTRELSFKFARAAIVVWELDSLTLSDSAELRQSQKVRPPHPQVFDWCETLLSRPRVSAELALAVPSARELDESCTFVLAQVAKFERRLNSGKLDIPYSRANELTSKYNFAHLFKMARQVPT